MFAESRCAGLGQRLAGALPYLLLGSVLAFLALFRIVNLDEGWYLGASRLVYAGQLPYRDFAYTQTPLLPYVYGLTQLAPIGPLYAGRLLTLLLTLLAAHLTGCVARSMGGVRAGIIALLLFASALYGLAFFAYTATYALTALLITLAVFVAARVTRVDLRNGLATACICAAVCVRLSALAAVPPFLLYLVLTSQRRIRALLLIGAVSVALFSLLLGPFALSAGRLMSYDILGFHTDRMPPEWQAISSRGTAIKTVIDFGLLLLSALIGLAAAWLRVRGLKDNRRTGMLATTLVLMALGMFAAHLLPRTTDSYYNSLLIPLLSILGGLGLGGLISRARAGIVRVVAIAFVVLILTANIAVGWRALQRNGLIAQPPLNQVAIVRQAADYLRRTTQVDKPLVTFDTHLALEAGLRVPPGLEMSIFSYRPTWTTEQARQYRAVNDGMLLDLLETQTGAAAFTEFDLNFLHGDRERLFETLNRRYRWVKSVAEFGPFYDDLRIYLPTRNHAPEMTTAYQAEFEQGIRFLGYDASIEGVGAKRSLRLALYWQASGATPRPFTVFTHILDTEGQVVAGQDNQPCHNTCPTTTWHPEEVVRDEYVLSLAQVQREHGYAVELGMYDMTTGQRLEVQQGSADPADHLLIQMSPVR